jgi:hypothetical protein
VIFVPFGTAAQIASLPTAQDAINTHYDLSYVFNDAREDRPSSTRYGPKLDSARVQMIDFTSLISRRSALAVGASGLSIGLIGRSGLRPLPAQNPPQEFTFALIGDLGYVPS